MSGGEDMRASRAHRLAFQADDRDVIKTACPLHKNWRCGRCDGSGYIVYSRVEWEERRKAQRATLKTKALLSTTASVGQHGEE